MESIILTVITILFSVLIGLIFGQVLDRLFYICPRCQWSRWNYDNAEQKERS